MTTPPSAIGTTRALRRMVSEAPALRRGLGITMLLAALGTAIQVVVPIVVQRIIDSEILAPGGVDLADTLTLGGIAVTAMLAAMVVRRLALVRLALRAAQGLSDLRVRAFSHIHSLSVLHVEAERRGSLVARVTSDVAAIQDFVDWGGVGLLIGAAQVTLAVAMMLVYQWRLALFVLGGVVLYGLLLVLFQRVLKRLHDQVRSLVGDTLAAIGETISGLVVVRAYGAEEATMAKVRTVVHRQFRTEHRTFTLGAAMFSSAEVFAGAITAGVIGLGVAYGQGWGLSAGTLLAMLFLVTLLVEPVQTLVETLDQAQSAAAGVRRIIEVLDTPVEIADPVDGVPLPDGALDVSFAGVWFRYPSGEQAVRDVSVTIPAGARVAVVGETGSGKSTFSKLATRLLDPTSGEVLVGGIPLDRVGFTDLRRRVVFVPQEGFLFDTTIAGNVRYGRPDASDARIERAFAELELDGWLASLPSGLATAVGERGSNLSAGERQLVALVRAWIANPDVLVLDEATSAVDPALEVQIRRAMEHLTESRTSITVAHRLSTAAAADWVMVFDQGRLVERGPHEDLVALGGVYAALHVDWAAGTGGGGRPIAPVQ
ncbi:MAG: ABC transporter ATP-binding protein [Acidimicrobiia bacterium]|nr:ABC transporter ATP-binding protein [Acidimicrobiia bacterium]